MRYVILATAVIIFAGAAAAQQSSDPKVKSAIERYEARRAARLKVWRSSAKYKELKAAMEAQGSNEEPFDVDDPANARLLKAGEQEAARHRQSQPEEWKAAREVVIVVDETGAPRGMPLVVYSRAIETEAIYREFMQRNGFPGFESQIVKWKFQAGPDGEMTVKPVCIDRIGPETLERPTPAEPSATKEKAARKSASKPRRDLLKSGDAKRHP
jgi:hypothetical protein